MNIDLKIIPHHKQRFTTLGDWKMCGNTLRVRISRLSDWRFEMAVFAHEFLEFIITHHQGITTKECDKFDAWFETQYDQGLMPKS
ncbi:MAG: hypothetical protein KGJ13_10415, partial [Patescibacteria group bacterium]|nr:hypothetical protein [Patescibacteria group bacterium]